MERAEFLRKQGERFLLPAKSAPIRWSKRMVRMANEYIELLKNRGPSRSRKPIQEPTIAE